MFKNYYASKLFADLSTETGYCLQKGLQIKLYRHILKVLSYCAKFETSSLHGWGTNWLRELKLFILVFSMIFPGR